MLTEMSDRKRQEPYGLTHVCDIKLKATNEQTKKKTRQELIDTDNSMVVTILGKGKRIGGG